MECMRRQQKQSVTRRTTDKVIPMWHFASLALQKSTYSKYAVKSFIKFQGNRKMRNLLHVKMGLILRSGDSTIHKNSKLR